jgi:hypothetical protein
MENSSYFKEKINLEHFDVEEILMNSISESIYWYAVRFPKYFISKLLPVIKE